MMPAAKTLDPVMGVDVHIVQPPGPVPPVPIPHPFIGMLIDPFDFVPIIGATIFVNGSPRALAGTAGKALPPHIPIGGMFVKPPANECEMFMGSSTVVADGDPFSYTALPALSCQDIGMVAPFRTNPKKKTKMKSLVLPTSVVLPIPMGPPVLVGGAPTISMMAMAFRALFALGPLVRRAQRGAGRIGNAMRAATARARRAGDALADALRLGPKGRNRINRAICVVTGHPVDVVTGKVFTDKVDFELPGAIPFKWERVWYSTSTYSGPLGHGWHHSYDAGLYVHEDVVLYRTPDGRFVSLPPLAEGQEHFDRAERITLLRDASGYAIRTSDRLAFRFLAVGRPNNEHSLSSISDSIGNLVQLRHNERGMLVEILDVAGRSIQFEHDRKGRIAAITAPNPNPRGERFSIVQYHYDDDGNLVRVIDALDQPAAYHYESHLLVKETDRNGLSFYFQYDAKNENGRCVRTWGDGGIYDHKITYDDERRVTTVVNSLGYKTHYEHDGALVIRTVNALGLVTSNEYNEWNELEKETDPLGFATTNRYDGRGNLVERTTPDGARIELEYGPGDLATRGRDALGGEWAWRYDAEGRLVERVNPLGEPTKFEWQKHEIAAVTDPDGERTVLSYDEASNLVGILTPDGAQSVWTYDALGRVDSAVDPNGNQERRDLDLAGRLVRVHEPDGNTRDLAYDAEGNVVRAKDRHYDVAFRYRGMGRLAARTQAGTTVEFEYDTEEQLVAIRNEHGRIYRFVLDQIGNVIEEYGFDGLRREYQRDKAGRVSKVLRPAGRRTTYTYDAAGRVVAVSHGDGSQENYAYDASGALLQASNDSGSVIFERDPLGRILKETQGKDWVASEYDKNGFRKTLRSSKGAYQTVRRNAMGDVLGVEATTDNSAGSSKSPGSVMFAAEFTRDLMGLELERSLPGGIRAKWQRDRQGRPVRHEVFRGAQIVSGRQYVWDVNDRLKKIIDSVSGPVDYSHDALGNLVSAAYADGKVDLRMPDAVGNLFRTADRSDRKYGPAGQLLESRDHRGTTRYEYDPEGSLIRKTEPGGGVWFYQWNDAGMLTRVTRPDGHSVEFVYDALARRTAKKYRDKTTRWIWDGSVPLHEWVEREPDAEEHEATDSRTEGGGAVAREKAIKALHVGRPANGPPGPSAQDALAASRSGTADAPITWLFEPESFAPLAKLVAGEEFSIVTDHLGAPRGMFDGGGGEVWSADICIYGDLRNLKGNRAACPFRWPGQYEDEDAGLYYNRFRYYSPETGEYASQDPIGISSGIEQYAYTGDPLFWCDPMGLAPAPGCGQPRYTAQSRRHVYSHGHAANSPRIPNKSRFRPTEGGAKFSDEVVNHPNVVVTPQPNGRIKYEVPDLGRNTGFDRHGNPTRGGTVIVEGQSPAPWSTYTADEVVTQFPT